MSVAAQLPERAVRVTFDVIEWSRQVATIFAKMREEHRAYLTYDEWLGQRNSFARAALDCGLVTLEELAEIDAIAARFAHAMPFGLGAQLKRNALLTIARKKRARDAGVPAHVESASWSDAVQAEIDESNRERDRQLEMRLLREQELAGQIGRRGSRRRISTLHRAPETPL